MCVVTDIGACDVPPAQAAAGSNDGPAVEKRERQVPHTPCFTGETEIATDRGPVAIEDLRVGDKVLTRDSGYQPVRWIGARRFDAAALAEFPELQPVRIPRDAIGAGMPARDLMVSPQHRLLVTGAQALALGGETEILVAAVDFMAGSGTAHAPKRGVIYYHILFDAHEVIWANGCWSESFLPEAAALDGLHAAQRAEILRIFPELSGAEGQDAYAPARIGIMVPSELALAG